MTVTSAPDTAGHIITVATFNLLDYQARPEERLPLIVAGMAAELPDLIALQEVSAAHNLGSRLQHALTAEALRRDSAPYHYAQQANLRNHELTVGILSRYPPLVQEWVDLKGQGRVALSVTVDVDGTLVGFVSTHLFWDPGPAGDEARVDQARRLYDWTQRTFSTPLTIVAGDFNATPTSATYEFLSQRWTSLFAEYHGMEPDWTAPTPLLPSPTGWQGTLDYLFASPTPAPISVLDARLFLNEPSPTDAALYPSDHIGVLARLAVHPGPLS
jgi:endonuclease/exonuclease/phosphatase family metal-dependent hydrolase